MEVTVGVTQEDIEVSLQAREQSREAPNPFEFAAARALGVPIENIQLQGGGHRLVVRGLAGHDRMSAYLPYVPAATIRRFDLNGCMVPFSWTVHLKDEF